MYSVAVTPAITIETKSERNGASRKHAGQSEQTGLFWKGGLKRQALQERVSYKRGEYRCSSHGQYEKNKVFFD